MRHFFYDPATGLLTGASFRGPPHLLEANTPPGHATLHTLKADHKRTKVDVETGQLAPHKPDKPDVKVTGRDWVWSEHEHEWRPLQTEQEEEARRASGLLESMAAIESAQARPMREIAIAAATGKPPPPGAVAALVALESNIAKLRSERAAIISNRANRANP